MSPEFVNRLNLRKSPELKPETLAYIDSAFNQILLEREGLCSPRFADMEEVISTETFDDSINGVDVALAAYLTWDIRETIMHYGDQDIRSIGLVEVTKRDRLGELLAMASKYRKIFDKYGLDFLTEPDKSYSPKLVTYLVGFGVRSVFGFQTNSEYRRFRGLIQVPPIFKDSLGNRR